MKKFLMNKKSNEQNEQSTQEQNTEVQSADAQSSATKPAKKKNIFAILSTIITFLSYFIYIAIDAIKIHSKGWTANNIVVTIFLILQIVLFLSFTFIDAKSKAESKNRKKTMKCLKIIKKITLKLVTLVPTIMLLVDFEKKVAFLPIFTVVVTSISLINLISSLLSTIIMHLITQKIAKTRAEKKQKKSKKAN